MKIKIIKWLGLAPNSYFLSDDLPQKTDKLPKDKPIVVTCSVGNCSSIALSILERAGFEDISNMLGDMTAWTNLGFPIKKKL